MKESSWVAIENLANRALLLTSHIHNIINSNLPKASEKHIAMATLMKDSLQNTFYGDFRIIVEQCAPFVQVHNDVIRNIKELETRLQLQHKDKGLGFKEAVKSTYPIIEQSEAAESKVQSVTQSIIEKLYDSFIHKRIFGRKNEIQQMREYGEMFFTDKAAKKEFIEYLTKLTGVIQEMYRIFSKENKIEDRVVDLFEETYSFIKQESLEGHDETKKVINDLEEAYNRLRV